jgi:hypothetical protein
MVNMRSTDPIEARKENIADIARSEDDVAALLEHLQEIIEGADFKGSHRSGQFLRYVVDHALAGKWDCLKERVIGVDLFGRPPSYNAVEDAIVRVTASDVRKRLRQHYGRYGVRSEFRLSLPVGSYIPEITRSSHQTRRDARTRARFSNSPVIGRDSAPPDSVPREPTSFTEAVAERSPPGIVATRATIWRRWRLPLAVATAFLLALWGVIWGLTSRTQAATTSALPWSALFQPGKNTELILSDPDIASIQLITGRQILVSDYAAHEYIPRDVHLSPAEERICQHNLQGLQTASVDTEISVKIAELAKVRSAKIDMRGARGLELSNLESDDNFIFLGSPRSDPWGAVFNNQLDFRFVFDPKLHREVIQDVHPQAHEQSLYQQTAESQTIGESYAIVALLRNLGHKGQVLLLAGENGAGTQAAGELVTDMPRLSSMVQNCGIDPHGPPRQFELLLGVRTMAGSLNAVDIIACHLLTNSSR